MSTRLLERIQSPSSEPLALVELLGEDYLSSPYYFALTAHIENSLRFDTKKIKDKPMSFRIKTDDGTVKTYHGLIASVETEWPQKTGVPNLTLVLRPWLWYLSKNTDSRVYAVEKPQSLPDIIKSVFERNGYSDYRFDLNKTYAPLTVCVQYQESDFNFISRLLEDAGIYYYFTHTEDKHTLVLTDAAYPQMNQPVAAHYLDDTHTKPHIREWLERVSIHPLHLVSQGYDFTKPQDLELTEVNLDQRKSKTFPTTTLQEHFHYDNAPRYANDTKEQKAARLQQKLIGMQLRACDYQGKSNDITWQAGTTFTLSHHFDAKQIGDYYIYAIAHRVKDNSELPAVTKETLVQHYENTFRAQSTSQVFVPQGRYDATLLTPRNRLLPKSYVEQRSITQPTLGISLATVVGPKDTPIYTDKYGRVKVQFSWDTHSKANENSFAWVRVKQAWGSHHFGIHFTPRVGQEVLVSFEHGDLNQPVVMGVMPSGSSPPPFTPGKTPTQLGFQTQSLAQEAMQHAIPGHQLMFDDSATHPSVNVHAYKDLNIVTQNNYTLTAQSQTTTVQNGNVVQQIGGKLIINAKQAVHLINGNSRISITPSDITIEADKIVMGAPEGMASAAVPASAPVVTPIPEITPVAPATTTNVPAHKEQQCNETPTPAPQSILGHCSYYQFRHDDFVKRHQGCAAPHVVPSYYLNYGLKYCQKFSTELYPKLSPVGRIWLPKARLLLQQYMETGLAKATGKMNSQYIDRNQPIANELNDEEFKDFAFSTHVQAYWDARFENLSVTDINHVKKMLDLDEYFDKDTWETMFPLGTAYIKNYLDQHTDDTELKTVLYHVCTKVSGKNDEICSPAK